ncbi:epidermal growth factor receptor-like [Ptychodera flava]|uniref:epidermal growth factor receptor-like n=1 Tax=Ptychodera flava TaxID=63121 RepID=UPI00396A41D2
MAWIRWLLVFLFVVFGVQLLVDQTGGVQSCPEGKISKNGVCQYCEGLCPKTCPGFGHEDFEYQHQIHRGNIDRFQGCTVINGSLVIDMTTSDGDPFLGIIGVKLSDLEVFKTVREVIGYVSITHAFGQQTDLSFLENLEIIHGRDLWQENALTITGTYLRSLGMVSLRKIMRGNVFVQQNPNMCYLTDGMFDDILENRTTQTVLLEDNRSPESCRNEGAMCHEQCTSVGCWGPGNTLCMECRNYKVENQCIEQCNTGNGQYLISEAEKKCGLCSAECLGACRGPGADQCLTCRHVKDGPFCRERCPVTKYQDQNSICQECHVNCNFEGESGGCYGPENTVGDKGCKSCPGIIVDRNETVVRCAEKGTGCPDRYFIVEHPTLQLSNTTVCQACHEECASCSDKHLDNCTDCLNYRQDGVCVSQCLDDTFPDVNRNCQKCHEECTDGCHGASPSDCHGCKSYKVLTKDPLKGNTTVCVSECPPDKPRIFEGNLCLSNYTDGELDEEPTGCAGDECKTNGSPAKFTRFHVDGILMIMMTLVWCLLH